MINWPLNRNFWQDCGYYDFKFYKDGSEVTLTWLSTYPGEINTEHSVWNTELEASNVPNEAVGNYQLQRT